jgi:peptidoglycan/xylan/chitin deacetylase (PgdA/CDA1 family)
MRGHSIIALIAGALCAAFGSAAHADIVTRLPTNEKVVALTFDACEAGQPMAFDQGVLDYLLERRLPFTVFASGRFVETNAADIRWLSDYGFIDIENHSWKHPNSMDRFDAPAVVKEVERAQNAISAETGVVPQFFRFPAGNYNTAGLNAVERMGLTVVHWRWASGDPDRHVSADALYHRVMNRVAPGDILIFHINGRGVSTAQALPRIVEALEAEGYRFVLVSDYVGQPHPHSGRRQMASLGQLFQQWVARAPLSALERMVD